MHTGIYGVSDPRTYVALGRRVARGGAQRRHVGAGSGLLERRAVHGGAVLVGRDRVGACIHGYRRNRASKQITVIATKIKTD
jgi:hypothetical protein